MRIEDASLTIRKYRRLIKWKDQEVDSIEVHEKCTKLLAQNVRKNAKCHSSQKKIDLSFVKNVSERKDNTDSKF